MSIKDALQKILPNRDKVERNFPERESIFKLGLSESPLTMEWVKTNGEVLLDKENTYLKSVDRRKNRTKQNVIAASLDSHAFRQSMEDVADKHQHTIKKVHSDKGTYYQIFNGPEHFIDYDLNGNCEFKTRDYKNPALKEYVSEIAERYKKNEHFIVYNVSNPDLPKEENENFLKLITKTLIDSGINFGRLQIANPTFHHILDSMAPNKSPVHVVKTENGFKETNKVYDQNARDEESVLIIKGFRFVELFEQKLTKIDASADMMAKQHNLRIRFEDKGDIILFESLDGGISAAFKTESIPNGKNLKAQVSVYEKHYGTDSSREVIEEQKKIRGVKYD